MSLRGLAVGFGRRGVVLPVAGLALAILSPVAIPVGTGFLLGWKFRPIETESMIQVPR